MVQGAEAPVKIQPEVMPELPKRERPGLKLVEKKAIEKQKKLIAKKIAACVASGIVASTATFIAFGEMGKLPGYVQEWYDETAMAIRGIFGIEEKQATPETQTSLTIESEVETPFAGLEIKGLDHIWQNNQWEYVDQKDGSMVGFWDENKDRFVLTSDVLKGEWEGLFIPKSPGEVEKMLAEGGEKEWTVENWEKGEIKIPIPFDITKGGRLEQIEAGFFGALTGLKAIIIGISDLPSNSETIIVSPLSHPDGGMTRSGGDFNDTSLSSYYARGMIELGFTFAHRDSQPFFGELYSDDRKEIKIGTPLLKLSSNDIISSPLFDLIDSSLNDRYQLLLTASQQDVGKSLDITFNNFLTDEKGRFIYTNPIPGEPFPFPGWSVEKND